LIEMEGADKEPSSFGSGFIVGWPPELIQKVKTLFPVR
jgi:hypothetical protein